jgi:hypothetical protein
MFPSLFREILCKEKNCLLCYFKTIGIVDVNLSRRWGERRYVCESWKQYMYHKSSPLSHTKVPKIELIVQLLKSNFISCPWGIPPIADCYIPSICQRNGIFEFITQCFMFISQLWIDLLFCVFVHQWTLVKKTNSFFVNHWFTWISATIHNLNYIPIGLIIIGHESFEVWIGNTIIGHHLV